jgi:hypothetical protein
VKKGPRKEARKKRTKKLKIKKEAGREKSSSRWEHRTKFRTGSAARPRKKEKELEGSEEKAK